VPIGQGCLPQVERPRNIVPSLGKAGAFVHFQDEPTIEHFQLGKLLKCCGVDNSMRETVGFDMTPWSDPPEPELDGDV
jgi:hypothetical protein